MHLISLEPKKVTNDKINVKTIRLFSLQENSFHESIQVDSTLGSQPNICLVERWHCNVL